MSDSTSPSGAKKSMMRVLDRREFQIKTLRAEIHRAYELCSQGRLRAENEELRRAVEWCLEHQAYTETLRSGSTWVHYTDPSFGLRLFESNEGETPTDAVLRHLREEEE